MGVLRLTAEHSQGPCQHYRGHEARSKRLESLFNLEVADRPRDDLSPALIKN
jgi:hypothetical protein